MLLEDLQAVALKLASPSAPVNERVRLSSSKVYFMEAECPEAVNWHVPPSSKVTETELPVKPYFSNNSLSLLSTCWAAISPPACFSRFSSSKRQSGALYFHVPMRSDSSKEFELPSKALRALPKSEEVVLEEEEVEVVDEEEDDEACCPKLPMLPQEESASDAVATKAKMVDFSMIARVLVECLFYKTLQK